MKNINNFNVIELNEISSNAQNFLANTNEAIDFTKKNNNNENILDHIFLTKYDVDTYINITNTIIDMVFKGSHINLNELDKDGNAYLGKFLLPIVNISNIDNIIATISNLLIINNDIDWNLSIDSDRNTIPLALAKNIATGQSQFLPQLLELKDFQTGLPLFKINITNKNNEKLIDVYNEYFISDNPLVPQNAKEIINILREKGSFEPNLPINPKIDKFDVSNVHNQVNEQIVDRVGAILFTKYGEFDEQKLDIIYKEIIEYINNIQKNEQGNVMIYEGATELEISNLHIQIKELFIDFKNNKYNEHNREFDLTLQVAYAWLEHKTNNSCDAFLDIISQFNGCFWGRLVNIYNTIYSSESSIYKTVIDFNKLQLNTEELNDMCNNVFNTLTKDFADSLYIERILKTWHQEMANFDFAHLEKANFSEATELVNGIFIKLFHKQINGVEAYSVDYSNFLKTLTFIIMYYNDEMLKKDANELYKIISIQDIKEEMLEIEESIINKTSYYEEKQERLLILDNIIDEKSIEFIKGFIKGNIDINVIREFITTNTLDLREKDQGISLFFKLFDSVNHVQDPLKFSDLCNIIIENPDKIKINWNSRDANDQSALYVLYKNSIESSAGNITDIILSVIFENEISEDTKNDFINNFTEDSIPIYQLLFPSEQDIIGNNHYNSMNDVD